MAISYRGKHKLALDVIESHPDILNHTHTIFVSTHKNGDLRVKFSGYRPMSPAMIKIQSKLISKDYVIKKLGRNRPDHKFNPNTFNGLEIVATPPQ